jgi:hypothetical protein
VRLLVRIRLRACFARRLCAYTLARGNISRSAAFIRIVAHDVARTSYAGALFCDIVICQSRGMQISEKMLFGGVVGGWLSFPSVDCCCLVLVVRSMRHERA